MRLANKKLRHCDTWCGGEWMMSSRAKLDILLSTVSAGRFGQAPRSFACLCLSFHCNAFVNSEEAKYLHIESEFAPVTGEQLDPPGARTAENGLPTWRSISTSLRRDILAKIAAKLKSHAQFEQIVRGKVDRLLSAGVTRTVLIVEFGP